MGDPGHCVAILSVVLQLGRALALSRPLEAARTTVEPTAEPTSEPTSEPTDLPLPADDGAATAEPTPELT